MEIGRIYERVEITDISPLGSGFAKCDGMGVFVPGAVTGDVCTFEITEVKKSYATARLLSVDEPSSRRCDVGCLNFPACGGCTMRHIDYALECDIKESFVKGALSKAGLRDVKVKPIIAPFEDGFRNKATFRLEGGSAGFYSEGSHSIVPLMGEACPIVPESFSRIAEMAARLCLRAEKLTVRASTKGELHLSFEGGSAEELMECADTLRCEFPCVTGVTLLRDGEPAELIHGERYLISELCGLKFRISPEAFFQVNYEGAEAMMDKVIEYAGRCEFDTCADLFCGTGVIGLLLASRYPERRFVGLEINPRSVEDAERNRRINKIKNIDFICKDAAKVEGQFELSVVDPPRRGLSSFMVKSLTRFMPKAIIYVSCNPATLARDAALLADKGYVIEEATPVNMFPRSGHCEVVCLLRR